MKTTRLLLLALALSSSSCATVGPAGSAAFGAFACAPDAVGAIMEAARAGRSGWMRSVGRLAASAGCVLEAVGAALERSRSPAESGRLVMLLDAYAPEAQLDGYGAKVSELRARVLSERAPAGFLAPTDTR